MLKALVDFRGLFIIFSDQMGLVAVFFSQAFSFLS
jgi:hypothetical protein